MIGPHVERLATLVSSKVCVYVCFRLFLKIWKEKKTVSSWVWWRWWWCRQCTQRTWWWFNRLFELESCCCCFCCCYCYWCSCVNVAWEHRHPPLPTHPPPPSFPRVNKSGTTLFSLSRLQSVVFVHLMMTTTTTTPSGSGGVPIQSKYDKQSDSMYIVSCVYDEIEAEIIQIGGVAWQRLPKTAGCFYSWKAKVGVVLVIERSTSCTVPCVRSSVRPYIVVVSSSSSANDDDDDDDARANAPPSLPSESRSLFSLQQPNYHHRLFLLRLPSTRSLPPPPPPPFDVRI